MSLKVLISGGGTGGHIFPAIAIADTIRTIRPETQFLFVGAVGKMEMERVPAAGYSIVGLNITGLQRSLSPSNLLFPLRLILALWKARSLLRSFQPDVVVGVGGFASGPVLRMATWMGFPTLIQEQNSFAGITNRWVAGSVSKACVAYDGMEKFFPPSVIAKTGNPVRSEMVQINGKRQAALSHFGLSPEKPVLLVIGGSLGARSINEAMASGVGELLNADIQVVWQTGKHFDVRQLEHSLQLNPSLAIREFIREMDLAYAAADIIVSRAGAIAVSELSIIGKPAILVPFPFAAEDHQTKNALALSVTGAAIHMPDKTAKQDLIPTVKKLFKDTGMQKNLSDSIKRHAKPNAASEIAKLVIDLAR